MLGLIPFLLAETHAPTALSPEAAISDVILQQGVMGAVFLLVVFPLAWYCYKLSRNLDRVQSVKAAELKAVQDARTSDSQAVIDKLLVLSTKWSESLTTQTEAIKSLKETMTEVKTVLQSVKDLVLVETESGRKH